MSSQDPIGSSVPPERPANPTHFGGTGLYEGAPDNPPDKAGNGEDAASVEPGSQASPEEPAKRHNVLTWVAVGGVVCLLTALIRRSTSRT